MINEQLVNPKSIVIVGGSNNIQKPGGKVLKNIIDGDYKGKLYVVNPKENEIQGIESYNSVDKLPNVDLAILAIASKFCLETVKSLTHEKNTKAFIILSAGFSEDSDDGALLEKEITEVINSSGGCLIGPNCIGVLTPNYKGVFTEPNPELESNGIDFVSGSGATAVFLMNSAIPLGVRFASLYSVGNSAQIGIEEVVKYWDENFDPNQSAKVKMLYMESIQNPQLLLKHASSLIRKGCKIAAIKAGSSEAGSRAASSHTGALANSDVAVDALFKRIGIVRCFSREELVQTAAIMNHKELSGKNIAIITHAGGPAVMLTDILSKNGFQVPEIKKDIGQELLTKLYHGSSISNPIDYLATGTAEQLDDIIDFVENKLDFIDGIIVIYGKTGLIEIFDILDVIDNRIKTCKKPIYTIFPTPVTGEKEMEYFRSLGHSFFSDEVEMGKALGNAYNSSSSIHDKSESIAIDNERVQSIISNSSDGYLPPESIQKLFDLAGIPRVKENVVQSKSEAVQLASKIKYPVVLKVVGPIHKTDVKGVVLNVNSEEQLLSEFERMIKIKDTTGILVQPMISGKEVFVGAKYEENFGHVVLCGLGGIFIEVLKDISYALAPVSFNEAILMIHSLKSYDIIKGIRGQEGVNEDILADILVRLSTLLLNTPEIKELDINPLLGNKNEVIAVDARIRIEK